MAELKSIGLAALLMLLYSVGIAGLSYRVAAQRSAGRAADAIAFGIAASPFAAGAITIAGVAALGASSDATYLWMHFIAATALAALSARQVFDLGGGLLQPLRAAAGSAWSLAFRIETLLAVLLLFLLGLLAFLSLVAPLVDNDALEYATVGKVLYERRALDAYPLVQADPRTGMFAPWTHPPLYPALILLAYILQGTPDTPGLMRLVAPYCLVAALVLLARVAIAALGARGWRTAILAAIIVLATPLLRRMVGGASIDALPILGLTLAFGTACLYRDITAKARIALVGTALGLSLWSHSQAVLFPILLLTGIAAMRWTRREPFLRECAGVLLVGALLGCAPYLRNYLIFGSPISDTPAVFALEQLDWNSYFTAARSLDSLSDWLIVGVLKGWTDYYEFWWTFWLMSAGAVLLALHFRRGVTEPESRARAVLAGAFAIVAVYLGGMLLSVLAGTSQMVRNPRYLLVILPFAALLGADALARLPTGLRLGYIRGHISRLGSILRVDINLRWPQGIAGLVVLATFAVLVCDRALQTVAEWRGYLGGSLRTAVRATEHEVLSAYPFYRLQTYIRASLPGDAVILTLRPADFYYAKHKMVSYLDPRLVPAYLEKDPAKLATMLTSLGVTHILRANYSIPPLYNSALMPMLADTRLARLLHDDLHYAVYALRPPTPESAAQKEPAALSSIDIGPGKYPWTGATEVLFPLVAERCKVSGIEVSSGAPQPTVRTCGFLPAHRATYVSGAAQLYSIEESPQIFFKAIPGATYRYSATFSGKGFLTLGIYEKGPAGGKLPSLDDGSLSAEPKKFARIYRLPPDATHFRFVLWVQGRGEIRIHDVKLEVLSVEPPAR